MKVPPPASPTRSRTPAAAVGDVPLQARGDGAMPKNFGAGNTFPYAVRWYGVTSLYGHFRNFISRGVAIESVDTRDWMRADTSAALLERAASILRAPAGGDSLVQRMGRDLWIDFVADTGDDRDTSEAVGRMLAGRYSVREGEGDDATMRTLPRGDVLLFGGDIAYPVATADEVHRRLTQPWNRAFRDAGRDGQRAQRLLLGVPGNHDWYDGLDGFGRLFRPSLGNKKRRGSSTEEVPSGLAQSIRALGQTLRAATPARLSAGLSARTKRRAGAVLRELHLDEVSGLLGIFTSVGRFFRRLVSGVKSKRRRRLVLHGYTSAQSASYFAIPLAPGLDLWGADRQLNRMDYRQRHYFRTRRAQFPDRRLLVACADPAWAYGEPNQAGQDVLKGLELRFEEDAVLYLAGDFHHYERRTFDRSTHVIAGGGGAFLHGTRIHPGATTKPDCVYPTGTMSAALLSGVPWNLVIGRSGYLVHLIGAALAAIEMTLLRQGPLVFTLGTTLVSLTLASVLYLIAGHERAHPRAVALVSLPFAAVLSAIPVLVATQFPSWFPGLRATAGGLLACAFLTALVYGLFLVTNARTGLEHQQAFTVLGHGGFKHFVRLCVHQDGSVDGYVIGKDAPLLPTPATLIDTFHWAPPERPDAPPWSET